MAHGGKRIGSGRKLGSPTKRTREIAERAIAEGQSPLEVMLENMRHFQKVAQDAEATLEGLTLDEFRGKHDPNLTPEQQFKALLAEVKKTAGLRSLAQECARDAASYMHPRLASVEHTVEHKRPEAMTDEEIERILRRRAGGRTEEAPHSTGKPH